MNRAASGEGRTGGAVGPAERNPARTVATVIAIAGALVLRRREATAER